MTYREFQSPNLKDYKWELIGRKKVQCYKEIVSHCKLQIEYHPSSFFLFFILSISPSSAHGSSQEYRAALVPPIIKFLPWCCVPVSPHYQYPNFLSPAHLISLPTCLLPNFAAHKFSPKSGSCVLDQFSDGLSFPKNKHQMLT